MSRQLLCAPRRPRVSASTRTRVRSARVAAASRCLALLAAMARPSAHVAGQTPPPCSIRTSLSLDVCVLCVHACVLCCVCMCVCMCVIAQRRSGLANRCRRALKTGCVCPAPLPLKTLACLRASAPYAYAHAHAFAYAYAYACACLALPGELAASPLSIGVGLAAGSSITGKARFRLAVRTHMHTYTRTHAHTHTRTHTHTHAHTRTNTHDTLTRRSPALQGVPIKMFQYEICPFCNKVCSFVCRCLNSHAKMRLNSHARAHMHTQTHL